MTAGKYYWTVPTEWVGETAFILGGGPSLTQEQVDAVRDFRRVALNDAGLVLAPDADVLCWGDPRWYRWNSKDLHRFKGTYLVTWRAVQPIASIQRYKLLQHTSTTRGLSTDPRFVTGNNTGVGGINLAFLFGARRIVLLGFDMQPVDGKNNWHTRHKKATQASYYKTMFMPEFEKLAVQLRKNDAEVVNCTANSALSCFPIRPWEEVVAEEKAKKDKKKAEAEEKAKQLLKKGPIPHADTQIKQEDVVVR